MTDMLPLCVRFGDFELHLRRGELRQGERTILLQEQPFQVLLMLVERDGALASREEIQKKLWPNDTVVEFDQSINAAIKKLRKALGDSVEKPTYIRTVAKQGYRLMVPVERVAMAGDDSSDMDEPHPSPKTWKTAGPLRQAQGKLSTPLGMTERDTPHMIGRTVSHYRVLDIIGGGGMGVVYRAEDLKLGRAVALKFLPEEMGEDPKALERFEREARAASALDHPNICSIYEFGEHEGQPFIVMQLLEGQTLRDHLASPALARSGSDGSRPQAFPLDQLLDVGTQIAAGLQAAHERGIIHRDIKPANIFLTHQGLVKILDFGVAKLVVEAPEAVRVERAFRPASQASPLSRGGIQPGAGLNPAPNDTSDVLNGTPEGVPLQNDGGGEPSLTRTGLAMGTAGYMSPEQVRGEKVDARTDLFSFGLVLYEMATGRRAFDGDTRAIVHDAILNQTPVAVHERNITIPPKVEEIINRAIEKDRELRYQSAAEMRADLESLVADRSNQSETNKSRVSLGRKLLATAVVVGIAMIAGGLYWRSHKPPKLTAKDTIVLADFANSTGDPVFDDTLKQALSIQLEQSPFLDLISDRKVNQTLKQMGRNAGDRLTPEITREVCQRTGSKAMLTGSIARLGNQYVIGVEAADCNIGDLLAEAQERAAGKEAVLNALDNAAVSLRGKLGESLSSVEKYATPLEEGTTHSLEALKAFSLGRRTRYTKGETAALQFFKRAVELDPNFALAYRSMAAVYNNLSEVGRSAENARKAYELRGKVSERERFSIEAFYYALATGELEKAAQTYELWQQNYPRDYMPYSNLGFIYAGLGNLEKELEEIREASRLDPNPLGSLAAAYQYLNRLDEAETVYKQAEERKLESETLLANRYVLAFLKGNPAQMGQLAASAMGKPGAEDLMLASQADTEGWYGKLKNARELTRRATDSAERDDAKETAAAYQAEAALREVESGNREQARANADAAVRLAPNRDVRAMAALALAWAGNTAAAERLAAELDKTSPLDTLVQRYWLPTVGAAVALQRKDPKRAIALLRATSTIELGQTIQVSPVLCPAYLRGQAYLMLHDGNGAAPEFQKFIDHYGLVGNSPWGALARLGVARAYALEAATDPAARDKARTAYQNFLTLWKDADPDIPIYRQAKLEYAKLQ